MAAVDRWANVDTYPAGTLAPLSGPAVRAFAITPNNTTDLAYVTRAIYCGAAGDLTVTLLGMVDGNFCTFTGVAAGTMFPLRVKRVWLGSPTNLIGLD